MKKHSTIFLLAATYIGTIVGAGFATGKEIIVFFSIYGNYGTFGIVICGVLFIVVGTKMMIISSRIGAYSYKELNHYLFGYKIGRVVNLFVFIISISITSVILSGAGALFQEQLGLSYQFGIILTLFLCYLVVLKGIKGIFAINAYLVPMLIMFTVFIATSIISEYPHELIEKFMGDHLTNNLSWFISPFSYAAFNLMGAQVILVPLGNEIHDEQIIKWGGFWGGFGLMVLLLLSHFSMSVFPETFTYEIPMAEVVKNFGLFIHFFFLFVIYGEIFNTVVGNVFGITRQLSETFNLRYRHAVLIMLFIIFCMSQLGYGNLLTVLYPMFGYIGLFFLISLLLKRPSSLKN